VRLFRRTSGDGGGRRLKLFFATDLHSSEACFRKFLTAARVYGVDALVLGGDLTGKSVIPLVPDGSALVAGDARLETEREATEFAARVADAGGYTVRVERDEAEALATDHDLLDRTLVREAAARAQHWVELAVERLPALGVRCYVTGGNDDPDDVLDVFAAAESPVEFCDGEAVNMTDEISLVSLGYSNPTPWDTPREVSEERLSELLEEVVAKGDPATPTVFNIHPPPAGSGLARCPELDTSTDPPTPVRVAGELIYHDAGSTAVRETLLEHQPIASLHGHIHEARGAANVGATTALNPGSHYHEGILRGVIVTISGRRIVHQFTSG
jgi:Icc-related predicted phosphoesterase